MVPDAPDRMGRERLGAPLAFRPTPLETHMDASHILVLVIAGLSALSVVTFTGAFLAMTREAREKR